MRCTKDANHRRRQHRQDRRQGPQGGLTLIEVMLALSILAAGLLAMLTVNIHAFRGGAQGHHVSEAARIAQDQMEILQRTPWVGLPVSAWSALTPVNGTISGAGVTVPQVYNWQFRVTAFPADPALRLVDVQVFWREPNQPAASPNKRYAMSSTRFNAP